jgi:hypothetical protein
MSSSEPSQDRNWRAGAEAAIVFSLILAYIWRLRFSHPYSWVPILLLIVLSHVYHGETLETLGLRWGAAPRTFRELSTVLVLVALALLIPGLIFNTIRDVSWRVALSGFALYCVWGLFQQYVLNGFFVNRFAAFLPHRSGAVSVLAGVMFSLAHLPNWFLMIFSLAGGYVCAAIYRKYRNLYFLGVAHGLIGFMIYLVAPDTLSHHLYVGPKWFSM